MEKCPVCGMEEVYKLGEIISLCDCVIPEEEAEEEMAEDDADEDAEEE